MTITGASLERFTDRSGCMELNIHMQSEIQADLEKWVAVSIRKKRLFKQKENR